MSSNPFFTPCGGAERGAEGCRTWGANPLGGTGAAALGELRPGALPPTTHPPPLGLGAGGGRAMWGRRKESEGGTRSTGRLVHTHLANPHPMACPLLLSLREIIWMSMGKLGGNKWGRNGAELEWRFPPLCPGSSSKLATPS